MFENNILFLLFIHSGRVGETGIVNITGVGEMGVGETGVGEMGQIIGETGVGEMGVGETGTSHNEVVCGLMLSSISTW